MKESIDLTEHRDFREDRVAKSPVKKYPHKSLPWVKAGDFELAEKRPQSYNSNFIYSTSTRDLTWNIRWNDLDDEFTIDDTVRFIDTFTNDPMIRAATTDRESGFIRAAEKWISSSSYYYYDSDRIIDRKLEPFPMGNKKYIIEHRKIEIPVPKYARFHVKNSYSCRSCHAKIARTPWHDTINSLCDTCMEKEELFDRLYMMKRHNIFRKKSGKKCQIGRRDLVFEEDRFSSVPCLSRRIPVEKKKRVFPKRYNAINHPYYVDAGRLYNMLFDDHRPVTTSMRKLAVYYKGRELRRREEPWQPNGRIRQSYDTMFEDTDWRDMLRHRLGVLNGPILAERIPITHIGDIRIDSSLRNLTWI